MKEVRFFVYTRSGRRPLRQKVATIQVAALPCTPFLFRLRRIPFGFTKETFPTALEGLLVDPNIIEVSVANHNYRDYEHEYITSVPVRALASVNVD